MPNYIQNLANAYADPELVSTHLVPECDDSDPEYSKCSFRKRINHVLNQVQTLAYAQSGPEFGEFSIRSRIWRVFKIKSRIWQVLNQIQNFANPQSDP